MFEKLLDFDEVCFEGAVVEEERRVGPGGQVFELGRLPGKDGEGGGDISVMDAFIQSERYQACQNPMWHRGLTI